MKVLIIKKTVTATHTLLKGKEYDLQSAQAKMLVGRKDAEFTPAQKTQNAASAKILADRKKAASEE